MRQLHDTIQILLNFMKEILREIGFIEEMRTAWGSKEVSHTFFQNSTSPYPKFFSKLAKVRFIPFDFVPLATLYFAFLWHHKKPTVDL